MKPARGEDAMLERLNDHRAWANRLCDGWLTAHAPSDDYCLKMLSHVLRAEDVWLDRLRGGVPANTIWNVLAAEELAPLRAANDAGLAAVLAGDPALMTRVFRYSRFDGTPMESTGADIVTHVCMHGAYHRAQIAAHAARTGLPKLPVTDFIAWAREFP
jgi:uncharacterized damage-inducible protein DinB